MAHGLADLMMSGRLLPLHAMSPQEREAALADAILRAFPA
jgi:hypothetical protein